MKTNRSNTDKLKHLREFLPHGAMRRLAIKHGKKFYQVQRILNGQLYDMPVIKDALRIAIDEKSRVDTLKEELDAIFK